MLSTGEQVTSTASATGPRRRRFNLDQAGTRVFLTVASGIFLFGLWEVLSRAGVLNPLIAPAPSAIVRAAGELLGSEYLWLHVRVTLIEVVAGFTLGVLLGLVMGILVAQSRIIQVTLYPYLVAIEGIPKIVLAPILITWFGYEMGSKIAMAILIAYFQLFINTCTGLVNTDRDRLRLMQSFAASRSQVFRKVLLPGAMPTIIAGVKISWTLAVIGAVVVEFIGSSQGVGYLIQSFNSQLRIEQVFVLIAILSGATILVYHGIERIERKLTAWSRNPPK